MQNQPTLINEESKIPVFHFNHQYMNNTKINRIISTKYIPIDEINTELRIPIKEKIINLVDLKRDPNITLSQDNITPYDAVVMDAVYTLICCGYTVVTADSVAKVMSGNPQLNVTSKKIDAIYKSIDKLRFIHITIRCKDEIESRKDTKNKLKEHIYDSYLLPLEKDIKKYEANGKESISYTVLAKPAHYRYAETIHQIIDIPGELLDTHNEFRDTEEAILIKRYVIKRVAQILNKNKLSSNKISYIWYDKENDEERGLFPELGYVPDKSKKWNNKKQKINKIVKLTLESLKKKKIIINYEAYKKGDSLNPALPIVGYKIYY